jgi:hypothetical protein
MAEIETATVEVPLVRPRRLRFDWLLPLFFRPGRTLKKVGEQTAGVWLLPMLIITVLGLAQVFVAGPIKQNIAINSQGELPQEFQWWSPQQQEQYMKSREAMAGPLFAYGLPAGTTLIAIWIGWVILAAILHLALTIAGSRSDFTAALNLTAWASLPFALRYLVQIVALLQTKTLISGAGLSGYINTAEGETLTVILAALLALIDLYFIWQLILLMVGARFASGLTAGKAAATTLLAFVIFWMLSAVPGFISAQMASLSFVRPFFF